ncbi:MAG: AAA family ATPase [archaeon]|nr:AAA family ATPase [archaeon]MCP8313074.1 AAA family ATPase [archaeon]
MLTHVKIENFRGIKEGEIELAPLTILLGPNNSGKTTILEALFLAPNPLRIVPYYPNTLASGVIYSLHKTLDSEGYAFLLYNYVSNQAKIECNFNGETYLLRFVKEGDQIQMLGEKTKTTDGEKEIVRTIFGQVPVSQYTHQRTTTKSIMENTLLINHSLIDAGYRYLQNNWASIVNLGICGKVAKESSEFSYESYRDITIEPFLGRELTIYAYLEDGRRIRLGDLGEGIQSYIISRILYELEKPKILLWDDIESHFNPRILSSIAEWFYDLLEDGRQVILTTHSIEATKIIAGLNEEKTWIYLTSLENNVLKTKRLTLKEVIEYSEAGIDIRVAERSLL